MESTREDFSPFLLHNAFAPSRVSFWSLSGGNALTALPPTLFADKFYLSKPYLDNHIFHLGLLQWLGQGQFHILQKS